MTLTTAVREINAPVATVFETVAHADNFAAAVPHLVAVEFVGDTRIGVGTRFRETRLLRGRQATTELEVTEYEPNARIRLVADEGGTIWDTTFEVTGSDELTTLQMRQDAKAYKPTAKLMNWLTQRLVARAIEGDMDAVKAYCERLAR